MASNRSALVAKVGSKALLLDPTVEVSRNGDLNVKDKQMWNRILRASTGVALLLHTDSTDKTSTTLTDVTDSATASTGTQEFGHFELLAGRWYEAEYKLILANGTAANGVKAALHISGTQTSIKIAGTFDGMDASNAAGSSGTSIALSSSLLFTSSPDTNSPYSVTGSVRFLMVADGNVKVQIAEKDTGSGTAALKAGSLLRVKCLS